MEAAPGLDFPYETDVATPGWDTIAHQSLAHNGFCVLRGTGLRVELCKHLNHRVQDRLARLLAVAKQSGHDPEDPRESFQFRELCKRMHPRRFDVRLPVAGHEVLEGKSRLAEADEMTWACLHAEARRWAWPVLKDFVGSGDETLDGETLIDLAGCVVSLSGSEPQKFHRDGKEGQYNVFVPLVPITAENGPTQFYPRSHDIKEYDNLFEKPKLVAPCLSLGDMLIFDYRISHRGLGNGTRAVRPVAYMVYARRGVHDDINFPNMSLFSDLQIDVDALKPAYDYLGHEMQDAETDLSKADDRPEPSAVIDQTCNFCPEPTAGEDELAIAMCDMESDIFGDATSDFQGDDRVEVKHFASCSVASSDSWWGQLRFSKQAQERLGVEGSDCSVIGANDADYCIAEGVSFVTAKPLPILEPVLVCSSCEALSMIGASDKDELTAAQLCGNELPPTAFPAAHVYCGFQYGEFAGQLGDGAALSLGELSMPTGDALELNMKGTGQNRLTRWWNAGATGRKSLDAMVREFILAESLSALDVPTTRALTVVKGSPAEYPSEEPCAVLLRSAATFLRFGSFEVTLPLDQHKRSAPSPADWRLLRNLADHCITTHFPEVAAVADCPDDDPDFAAAPRYRAFVFEVTRRTARLAAKWQCLGAVHGMLNTDNLSIIGLTLDHGSFTFMDAFDGCFVGRASDSSDRYCFRKQPGALRWACERFSEALLALHCTDAQDMASEVGSLFDNEFQGSYDDGMRQKLGLKEAMPDLVSDLMSLMELSGADWTYTFSILSSTNTEDCAYEICRFCTESGMESRWKAWLHRYMEVVSKEATLWDQSGASRMQAMSSVNPKVVPRRWLLKKAEDSANAGDYTEVMRIFEMVTSPFEVPSNPADALPSPPIAKIDPAMLGSMGSEAVEMLEDAEFWRRLCPGLHVSSPDSTEACTRTFRLSEERAAKLKTAMKCDGCFTWSPEDLWAADLSALARGVEELCTAGLPSSFIWVYDEAWMMLAQLAPILHQVLDLGTNFDLGAVRVPAGETWLPPRRDRPFVIDRRHLIFNSFREDGTPLYSTCWIPLLDVPQTSSCLMCVPKHLDHGYTKTTETSPIAGLHQLDKVRPLSMDAGGACVFSHRCYHWGKIADSMGADGSRQQPRFFMTIAVADKVFELSRLPRHVLPLPPLQLRVALAAGQALVKDIATEQNSPSKELLWSCFLACANHFSADFGKSVSEAFVP